MIQDNHSFIQELNQPTQTHKAKKKKKGIKVEFITQTHAQDARKRYSYIRRNNIKMN